MTSDPGFPRVETHLPELIGFVSELTDAHRSGDLQSWEALAERVHAFFTPERLDQVERVVPGWREMSGYADSVTLVHVMCTFIGLLKSPEYDRASPAQQEQARWIVLLHDLAKWVREGARDSTHAFRSAALAGAILPRVGFPATDAYEDGYAPWAAVIEEAVIVTQEGERTHHIQDNSRLPEIVDGIERLYGQGTPAARIIQTILLHTSISTLQAWPQAAPLTEEEARRYLDPTLLPLLKMMMLADNDGWELFDASTSAQYRQETLDVFEELANLIG